MKSKMSQHDFHARLKPAQTRGLLLAALMATAFTAVAQETNLLSALDYPAFQIIAERNIFNQDRTAREHDGRPAARIADSFSLVGTLFYAGGDIAFFDGTSDAYRKALKVGGDIAGFKVTAVTLNSVTLFDGTNQAVLKITTQMRRDDDGHWSVSAEPVSYSSADSSSGVISGKANSNRAHHYHSNPGPFRGDDGAAGTEEPSSPALEDNSPDDSAPPGEANANTALERLMQRRAQEEQQLGQGQ